MSNTENSTIAQKLVEVAENQEKIYNAGYNAGAKDTDAYEKGREEGYAEGEAAGYENGMADGKQAEYDAFWDAFQRKGSRTNYSGVFGGECWNNGLLNPKYNLDIVDNASYMFYYNTMGGDLVEYFKSIGKIFSLEGTGLRNLNSTFQYSFFTRVGKIHTSGDNWYSTFYGCKNLVTIDEVGNGDENGNVLIGNSTFNGCTALENIAIRGKIVNSTSFQWSTKLNRASIENIINHLSDDTTGKTLTLSKTAVLQAFELSEVEEGWLVGTYIEEWRLLTDSKQNWTITLV